jgi:hypothetical protein
MAERTCFLQVLLALLVAGGCTAHRCYKKRAAAGQAEFSNFEDGIDSIPPNRPTAENGGGGGVPYPYDKHIAAQGTIVGSVLVGPGGAMQVAQPQAPGGGGGAGGVALDPFGVTQRIPSPQRLARAVSP